MLLSNLQRGHCFRCRQTWVLGQVDPMAGEYGQFVCAACRDETAEEEENIEAPLHNYDDDDVSNISHRGSSSKVALQPPKSKRKRKRKRCGAACRTSQSAGDLAEADALSPLGFPTTGVYVDMLRISLNSQAHFLRVVTWPVSYHQSQLTCGSSIWYGARVLLKHMERTECLGPGRFSGQRLIEIGAGVGVPGVGLAQLGAEVLLTDVPGLCPLLRLNVAANIPEAGKPPAVAALRWESTGDLTTVLRTDVVKGGLDFVIGSEIGYDSSVFGCLFATLRALATCGAGGRPARVILALAQRTGEYEQFEEAAHNAGWALDLREIANLPVLRGDPMCSPVAVVELRSLICQ